MFATAQTIKLWLNVLIHNDLNYIFNVKDGVWIPPDIKEAIYGDNELVCSDRKCAFYIAQVGD